MLEQGECDAWRDSSRRMRQPWGSYQRRFLQLETCGLDMAAALDESTLEACLGARGALQAEWSELTFAQTTWWCPTRGDTWYAAVYSGVQAVPHFGPDRWPYRHCVSAMDRGAVSAPYLPYATHTSPPHVVPPPPEPTRTVSETQKPHIAWLAGLANEATAQAAVRQGLRAAVDEQTKWDAKLMRYMSGPQYGGESGSFFGLLAPDPPPPDDPVAAELHAAYVVADSAATAAAEAERRAHRDTKLMISVELAAAFPNQRQANPYICPDLAAYWMEHEDQLDRAAAASAVAAAAAASAAECLRNNWEPAVAAAHAEQAITTATAAAERSAKARIESRDSRMLYFQQVTLPRMIERGQKRL